MYNEEIALKRKREREKEVQIEKLENHDRFMKYQLISVWLLKLNNGNEARLNTRRSSSSSSSSYNNNNINNNNNNNNNNNK